MHGYLNIYVIFFIVFYYEFDDLLWFYSKMASFIHFWILIYTLTFVIQMDVKTNANSRNPHLHFSYYYNFVIVIPNFHMIYSYMRLIMHKSMNYILIL